MKNSFAEDMDVLGGYTYTRSNSLSGRLSNERISKAILHGLDCHGKTVLDIGCGDGAYTLEYITSGARSVVGIDPVDEAIRSAAEKYKHIPNLSFKCQDLYTMPVAEKYDVAIVRGVLHHTPDIKRAIRVICSVAKEIVVVEPNGYNPVLKIIEKLSPYHVQHEERSFPPCLLRREFEKNGATLLASEYVGLAPFFCPDWLAKILKFFEPAVEKIVLIKQLACGQYVFHVRT